MSDSEFHIARQANDPAGKLLSANDVVNNPSLVPAKVKGYFKDENKKDKYPYVILRNASIYLKKCEGQDSVCIAKGGDGIVYGQIVSRNEFGIDCGIFWSPDKTQLAFYRKDESAVRQFPLLDIKKPGGVLRNVRYPMIGEASERISLGIYDLAAGKTVYLKTEGEFSADQYITNLCWSRDSRTVYAQLMDRKQQNVHLNAYCAASGKLLGTILTEHSDTFIEPLYPLHWIDDTRCIYTTDNRDGVQNLYVVDVASRKVKRLAKWDRYMEYLSNDGKFVYFTGPDEHPVNNYLWRADIKSGKVLCLTPEKGWHSVDMNKDCTLFTDIAEALDKVPVSTLRSAKDGKVVETLKTPADPTEKWAYTAMEMGSIATADSSATNYWRLVKPLNFDPSKKYPLILYVYGGPHSQLVRNEFLGAMRRWEMYAAQKGFAVLVMDGRGTRRHDAAYEHALWHNCGVCEMEDQMKLMEMAIKWQWVDTGRIGVYGWSYGGFMSLSLATGNPDLFKVCVAGGAVIDWRWYEVMYGERYMGTPVDNLDGFEKTSLINKAACLKARTLLIQGAVDETVLPVNLLSFLQKCIDNGIHPEYFTYPNAAHNMHGSDRVHLADKITDFFLEHL